MPFLEPKITKEMLLKIELVNSRWKLPWKIKTTNFLSCTTTMFLASGPGVSLHKIKQDSRVYFKESKVYESCWVNSKLDIALYL
jgi:hypothetical protein